MKISQFWKAPIDIKQVQELQIELAKQISRVNGLFHPHFIAGSDISAPDSRGIARAVVVVLEYPKLKIVETQIVEDKLTFPYVPGLLSFRELPLIVSAFEKLSTKPDLLLVDGQGIAHPRRLGIASHLGLFLDIPTIGCAKSRLCGTHKPLTSNRLGSHTQLIEKDELIGVVLRTKPKTKPLYISIGHKIDLPTSIYWVKKCLKGYRLPEPSRLAHLTASNRN
jgi:deoxyribonuclease V